MHSFKIAPALIEERRLAALALADSETLISVKQKHLTAALAWQMLADNVKTAMEEHEAIVADPITKPPRD